MEEKDCLVSVEMRDVSNIIKGMRKFSDALYLDAIEANYSHESMTPLNSIIANSRIVMKRLTTLMLKETP